MWVEYEYAITPLLSVTDALVFLRHYSPTNITCKVK